MRSAVPSTLVLLACVMVSACGGAAAATATPAVHSATPESSLGPSIGGGSPAPPTPSATISVGRDGVVTLTQANDGATLNVKLGTTLRVVLAGNDPPFRWSEPVSSSGQVVQRTVGGMRADGSAWANFRSIQPGEVVLSAMNSPYCQPPCGAASATWQVNIVATS